jgi:hypothetical protein
MQLLLLTMAACKLLRPAAETPKCCAPGVCASRCGLLLLLPWRQLPDRRLLRPGLLLLPLLALPMPRETTSNPPVVVQLLPGPT